MAHSAYPHLGESAIEKLLDALERVRRIPLPRCCVRASTLNIGTIQGGRAPNVIPDDAQAEIFFRLVDDGDRDARRHGDDRIAVSEAEIARFCASRAEIRARSTDSRPPWSPYTTDIPAFGGAWGEPFLIGPGSIHVAHTDRGARAEKRID